MQLGNRKSNCSEENRLEVLSATTTLVGGGACAPLAFSCLQEKPKQEKEKRKKEGRKESETEVAV